MKSVGDGFETAGCTLGVPMIPKPKSEAWLLCACKADAYQNCAALENESGNDKAANPLKSQLHVALDGKDSWQELCDAIEGLRIDPGQIDMPSFNPFRERLHEVIEQACSGYAQMLWSFIITNKCKPTVSLWRIS